MYKTCKTRHGSSVLKIQLWIKLFIVNQSDNLADPSSSRSKIPSIKHSFRFPFMALRKNRDHCSIFIFFEFDIRQKLWSRIARHKSIWSQFTCKMKGGRRFFPTGAIVGAGGLSTTSFMISISRLFVNFLKSFNQLWYHK